MESGLVSIVRSVLTGEKIGDVLWKSTVKEAKQHNLLGFLYYATRKREDLTPEQKKSVAKMYEMAVAQQLQQDVYAKAIFDALVQKKIPHMPLKGYGFRPLYPSQDLRFSCDIDFFYDEKYTQEVQEILTGLGFEKKRDDAHNFVYMKGIITVEPHFAIADGEKEQAYYQNIWQLAKTEDGITYHFSDEDFYIYHLLHTYKHMSHGGAGVRSVIDTWVWNEQKPHMDREYLARECEKLGITRFAAVLERLSRVWFGDEETDDDMVCLGKYILQGGAYGTSSQQAQMGYVTGTDKKSLRRARRRYLMHRLFPTYKELRMRYPVLKKCPLLVPFLWLARLFVTLFTPKRKRIEQSLDTASHLTRENAAFVARVRDIIG